MTSPYTVNPLYRFTLIALEGIAFLSYLSTFPVHRGSTLRDAFRYLSASIPRVLSALVLLQLPFR